MSKHFIGQPEIQIGFWPYKTLTSDLMPTREQIMGITVPNAWSSGVNWVQLPTADGANTTSHMNAYGQMQNGGSPPNVGDWVEWNFGAIRSDAGLNMWAHLWTGPNLGTFQVSWNGVNVGAPIDCYSAAYVSGVGMYRPNLEPAGYVKPRKNTMRWTITGKNASSSGNYLLVNSVCVYGALA